VCNKGRSLSLGYLTRPMSSSFLKRLSLSNFVPGGVNDPIILVCDVRTFCSGCGEDIEYSKWGYVREHYNEETQDECYGTRERAIVAIVRACLTCDKPVAYIGHVRGPEKYSEIIASRHRNLNNDWCKESSSYREADKLL